MSARYLQRLQKEQSENQEIDEESSEEEVAVKHNFFNQMMDYEDLPSDESDQEEVKQPTKIVQTQPENEKQDDFLILEQFENEQQDSFYQQKSQQPCLKRKFQNFDFQSELKALFRERDMRRAVRNAKRMILTPGKEGWPKNIPYLLSMEMLYENCFSFTASNGYQKTQENYLIATESNNPNHLMQFLQQHPFHVEALYQVIIFYQLQANYEAMGPLIERALYSFELSFHHQFSPLGNMKLDYQSSKFNEQFINRIFYKCLFMQIDYLGRKGCMRSALELVKFLLVLSPDNDWMGAIFLIDYYSIRAKRYDDFIYFVDNFAQEYLNSGHILEIPNLIYSTALAKALKDPQSLHVHHNTLDSVKSLEELMQQDPTTILLAALKLYPYIGKLILEKLSPASQILSEQTAESPLGDISHISNLYVTRCTDLWKPDFILTWLRKTALLSEEFEWDGSPLIQFVIPLERYAWLDSNWFSDEVRNLLPDDQPDRAAPRGNLDPMSHPLYLFLATMLPENFVNFDID